MASFGRVKEHSSNSSSSTSFNPLDLLNKLRGAEGGGGGGGGAASNASNNSSTKYRRTPMESPLKSSISSPLPGGAGTEAGLGAGAGSLSMGSEGKDPNLSIAVGESEDAFEQRIKHFKELQEMNAEILRLRKQNKKLLQEKDTIRKQMMEQKAKADNTIAQLRARLATPSKSTRDMNQFPTFGPPRKPIHFSPTSSSINKQPSYEGSGHNSSSSSGLQSPNSPIPLRGNQQLFIPSYPSENASGIDDANGMYGMRSPYQDPTFNAMMRMSTPSKGIYGDQGHEAYSDMMRRGPGGHVDPAMMMRMQQQQQQQQQANSYDETEGTSQYKEDEEEEVYHIDLSN